MAIVLIEAKVASFDKQSGEAELIQTDENDDVIRCKVWAPAHFGGQHNPYPEKGEELVLRYDKLYRRIVEIFRPSQTAVVA
jgi:hypothetical protein